MLEKLVTTRKGNTVINSVFATIGLILGIVVRDARIGIIVFLAVTALESGVFSLVFGLRSSWRKSDAARAVFWAVLAYFGLAFQGLTLYLIPTRWWWTYGLRQMLYLGLAVAGLNLVLTLTRTLRSAGNTE
jgi:hypothetical protein